MPSSDLCGHQYVYPLITMDISKAKILHPFSLTLLMGRGHETLCVPNWPGTHFVELAMFTFEVDFEVGTIPPLLPVGLELWPCLVISTLP